MEIGNLKGPFQFWHGLIILSYPTSENKTNLPFIYLFIWLLAGDFFYFFKYKFIYFNWRLITLQYCIGFAIHQHESHFKGQEILLENWCKWKEKKPLKSEVPESKYHLCYFFCDLGEVIPTHFTFSHTMLQISRVILDDFPLFPSLSLSSYYPPPNNSSISQWQGE